APADPVRVSRPGTFLPGEPNAWAVDARSGSPSWRGSASRSDPGSGPPRGGWRSRLFRSAPWPRLARPRARPPRARSLPCRWPRATLARWRSAIERSLDRNLGAGARELVVPLVIGDRSALSPALNGRLRAAGVIHLLALSGLHIAWMASIARGLAAMVGGGTAA